MPQCINIRRVQEGSKSFTAAIDACPAGNCMELNCNPLTVPLTCRNQFEILINGTPQTSKFTVSSYEFGIVSFTISDSTFALKGNDVIEINSCTGSLTSNSQTVSSISANILLEDTVTTCDPSTAISLTVKSDLNIYFGGVGVNTNPIINITSAEINTFTPVTVSSMQVSTGSPSFTSAPNGDWGFLAGGNTEGNYSLKPENFFGSSHKLKIIQLQADKYWSVTFGYLNVINTGTEYKYTNALVGNTEITIPTIVPTNGHEVLMIINGFQYILSINGEMIFVTPNTVTYTPSAGSITGNIWTLPAVQGNYSIVANVGNLRFSQSITETGCGNAVNDAFTGIVGGMVTGSVAVNDTLCSEYTKWEYIANSATNGVVNNFNQNTGAFVFYPLPNFSGIATFQYRLLCSTDNITFLPINTATVNITMQNAQAAINDRTLQMLKGGTLVVDSRLTSSLCNNGFTTFGIDVAPNNGQITNFNVNTGTYTYTPTPSFSGIDTMTVAIYCNGSKIDTAVFSIQVIDISPCRGLNSEPVWQKTSTWKCVDNQKLTMYLQTNPCASEYANIKWEPEGTCGYYQQNCGCRTPKPTCPCNY